MTPDIIKQVAFATDRILHAGTGEPIVGSIHITARERPIVAKVLEDGTFVISGDLARLFAEGGVLTLDIRADSAQFRFGFVKLKNPIIVTIPPRNFDPEDASIPPDSLFPLGRILLPDDPADYLQEIPVNIHGRVFEAENPETPIVGARVEVHRGATPIATTTTGAGGRYRMNNIVVLAPAEISCSSGIRITQTRNLLIDFGRLTHEEYFRLAPEPSP